MPELQDAAAGVSDDGEEGRRPLAGLQGVVVVQGGQRPAPAHVPVGTGGGVLDALVGVV